MKEVPINDTNPNIQNQHQHEGGNDPFNPTVDHFA
jgi:hypothetical protein